MNQRIICRKTIILSLILWFQILSVYSQETDNIFFDRITSEFIKIEKGLSQNTVFTILQDHDGFMWFGTWDGLNKYDGNKFTVFNRDNGLSNQTIYSIFEDTSGHLWIGTENGLNKYDPAADKIKIYLHNPDDPGSISDNWINQIYTDNYGNIWIATARGINLYKPETDSFQQYLNSEHDNTAIRSNWINKMLQDDFNNYWLATRYGLIHYNFRTKLISRYYHKPDDSGSLSSNFINTLYKDSLGILWIGTRNGLSKLDPATKSFRNYRHIPDNDSSLSGNNVTSILTDAKGNTWIGTDGGGLNLFDQNTESFFHFKNITSNINSISNDRIYCLYEDRSGNLWIGSFNGVNKIDNNSSKFPVYRVDPEIKNSLNNNFVRAFYEFEPGIIWIGTEKGINILDESTGTFDYIHMDPEDSNTIPSNNIRDFFKDSRGNYWIGTGDSGLVSYNPESKSFTTYSNNQQDPASICGNFILNTNEDDNGKLWVSAGRGISVFDPETGEFKNYLYDARDQATAGLSQIYDIHKDRDGILWFASQNGLSRYYPEVDSFSIIDIQAGTSSEISSNKLFSIYEDDSSNFWIGTRGGGFVKYNKITGESKTYTEKDGLPNNVVYGFLEDDDANLWISTNRGISKFNPGLEFFINYDVRDGLQSNEFNSNSFLKSGNGKMYFGGMMGFNCFFPYEIKTNRIKPAVKITGFSIFHIPQPPTILQPDTIYLNYDENFFSIEFASLDYTNPSKNKYLYILKDFDKQWRQTDANNPQAEYTRVHPGIYDFTVIGSNNDGIWNTRGDSLTIVITPPWYQSWAFRILFILSIIIIVWILLISRIRVMKKKHQVEKKVLDIERQMFELEQKALQLQMNPHFIFNSLNSIQSFILQSDTDKAINYLAKFSQLMRMTLTNSRESYIPLKEEITALRYYMDIERLRFDDKFKYEIDLDPLIDEEFLEIPPMILQPYVENAIIHGLVNSPENGIITIRFNLQGSSILCTIEDNGIGREKAEERKKEIGIKRKSRGIMITKERLEILTKQHKEKFSVQIIDLKNLKGEASGTRVEISIHFKES